MSEETKFDVKKFNNTFEDYKIKTKREQSDKDKKTLAKLNNEISEKPLSSYNMYELIIELKNTWFYIIDDILNGNITTETITKKNRLFYIGLTFVIFGIVIYLINSFGEDEKQNISEKIIEKHYIYTGSDQINNIKEITKDITENITKD